MTVRLAPHKVSKILFEYFRGLPQPKIAERNRVNQGSVSHYASRLKERINEIGLLAAGKELGIMHEIDSLRSLAVELYQKRTTVEEAKEGLKIIRAFNKLGIPPRKYAAMVEVCGKIEAPDFTKAALKLVGLEKSTGMSYGEVILQFENLTSGLNDLDARKSNLQAEQAQLDHSLKEKQKEFKAADERLTQIQKQAKAEQRKLECELSTQKQRLEDEKKRLNRELDNVLKKNKVAQGEIDDVAGLKAELEQRGLDLPTLIMLAEEFKK